MGMGGGGGSKTVQTTTQELAPEQRQLLKGVIPIAQDFLKDPPNQYKGSGIAPFTPLQREAQEMTLGAASGLLDMNRFVRNGLQGVQQGFGGTADNAMATAANVFPMLNATGQFGISQAGQTEGMVRGVMRGGNDAIRPGMDFLTGGAVLDPNQNQYLRAATESAMQPAIDQFRNQILPSIGNEAISAGGFGGTRQQIAEGLAGQGLTRTLGDITTNMYSNAYGQGLGAMTQGLNTQVNSTANNMQALINSGQLTQQAAQQLLQAQLGGFGAKNALLGTAQQGFAGQQSALGDHWNIGTQSLLPAQLKASVGEQQQAMKQAQLTEQIQKYINQQLIPFSAAQDVAALAFGVPGGQTSANAQTTGGAGSNILPYIQGGLGIATALPALFGMFSDRKLKMNIEPVQELSDGLTVYEFEFKAAPGARLRGFMADEVEELYPEAVRTEDHGYKIVAYNKVPSWLEYLNVPAA